VRNLETTALVLHCFDYRETSCIVRLATQDAGVVSAIARGARRPKSRFGSALDLFSSGVAHLSMNPVRDLHGLAAFDVVRSRGEIARSLARFAAASAIAELCLRFGREDDSGRVHDGATALLDAIEVADGGSAPAIALAGAWRLVADLGFAPALTLCASCHADLPADRAVTFHHRAGGALCERCAPRAQGGRQLPSEARRTLDAWLGGHDAPLDDAATARAHQRLLREFLEEHLGDGRPLRAFISWEEHNATGAGRVTVPGHR
jgi:DNA repair protein RecO (recombination protein O)